MPGEETELRVVMSLDIETRLELRPLDSQADTWAVLRSPVFLFFGWYDLQRTGWAQSVPSISVGPVVGPDCWMLYLCPFTETY